MDKTKRQGTEFRMSGNMEGSKGKENKKDREKNTPFVVSSFEALL